jgi:hypothetical protein
MPFAQLAYKQFVGSSHLGINEVGCFLVSDANLLQKIGVTVDPPTLNTFYTQHKLYTYDLTDKANDDITWSTVTKYCPQLVVNQIGGAGFPNSDLAQVEFHYRSVQHPTLPNGQPNMITHFCAVNSAADHSIIDSWDGKVKTPAEYEHVYGQPIAWATFTFHTPQTTPTAPVAAPVSAPAAVVPPSQPAPQPAPPAPSKLYLPPSVWIWHIYKEGGPYTLPYAIGALDPKMFNGLTYDILGNPAPHVYIIQTQMFGKVAIYAGPDTVAQFPGTGHGEGESTSVPVSEVVPAPTMAPAPDAAPSVVYTRFEQPMELVTNKDAHTINFESGNVAGDLPEGTPFVAVGKATLPNGGDVYFMDDNSFGIADERQSTPITVGVKTIDLSPAKTASAADTSATNPSSPVTTSSTASGSYNISETSLPWQKTFTAFMGPMKYIVKDDMKVYDFATGNDEKDVSRGDPITVGGKFQYAGALYYRAQSSIDKGTWYGFPVTSLVKQDANNTPFNTHDDINQLGSEIESISKAKHIAIKAGGTADGILTKLKLKRSANK